MAKGKPAFLDQAPMPMKKGAAPMPMQGGNKSPKPPAHKQNTKKK